MPLTHRTVRANDVRAPEVARGEVLVVGRYRDDNAKVALVNPEDLLMLEESHDLLESVAALEPSPLDDLTRKALALEDRPGRSVEDPERIVTILDL